MSQRLSLSLCFALISLTIACGPQSQSNSELDGHYEESSARAMQVFDGQQEAIAEYEAVQDVIISLPLLTEFNKELMAREILNSGIDTLWITVPSDYQGDLQDSEFAELRRVVGDKIARVKLLQQREDGPLTVWSRDWAPLGARTTAGKLRLVDFNYYPNRSADDSTARSMLPILRTSNASIDRVSVPVYNEGGNFMNNSQGVCMMTTRVTDANAVASFTTDMILNNNQIKDYYRRFAGCRQTYIFPRMPYEGTGHIDMWGKFLDSETVLVGEVRDEILSLDGYTAKQVKAVKKVQTYLNQRANEIAGLGYKIVRVPMPAPVATAEGGWMFRSYTNSLTSNKFALVPRYLAPANTLLGYKGNYIDQQYLARYELEAINVYRKLGYIFKWIVTDDLIAAGGAVHCTTMQLGRVPVAQ